MYAVDGLDVRLGFSNHPFCHKDNGYDPFMYKTVQFSSFSNRSGFQMFKTRWLP
jgi:hypothetical protein